MAYNYIFIKTAQNNYISYSYQEISSFVYNREKGSYCGDVSHLTPGYTCYFLITKEEATEIYPAREKEEHWYTVTHFQDDALAISQVKHTLEHGIDCRGNIIDPIPLPNLILSPQGEKDEIRNARSCYVSLISKFVSCRGIQFSG